MFYLISVTNLFEYVIISGNFQTGEYHLKRGLNEELDFVFVPEEAWIMLRDRFNLIAPHHEVKRNVIESGMFVKQAKVNFCGIERN